jgi:hypothetical protein
MPADIGGTTPRPEHAIDVALTGIAIKVMLLNEPLELELDRAALEQLAAALRPLLVDDSVVVMQTEAAEGRSDKDREPLATLLTQCSLGKGALYGLRSSPDPARLPRWLDRPANGACQVGYTSVDGRRGFFRSAKFHLSR